MLNFFYYYINSLSFNYTKEKIKLSYSSFLNYRNQLKSNFSIEKINKIQKKNKDSLSSFITNWLKSSEYIKLFIIKSMTEVV